MKAPAKLNLGLSSRCHPTDHSSSSIASRPKSIINRHKQSLEALSLAKSELFPGVANLALEHQLRSLKPFVHLIHIIHCGPSGTPASLPHTAAALKLIGAGASIAKMLRVAPCACAKLARMHRPLNSH